MNKEMLFQSLVLAMTFTILVGVFMGLTFLAYNLAMGVTLGFIRAIGFYPPIGP